MSLIILGFDPSNFEWQVSKNEYTFWPVTMFSKKNALITPNTDNPPTLW